MSASKDVLPLWEWALECYSRDGVAQLCLAQQERYGADVNLLLLALWLGARGQKLGVQDDPAAIVAAWHETVVVPLRSARRAIKGWPMSQDGPTHEDRDSVRAKVQAAEIETERLELALLANWAASAALAEPEADVDIALNNLRRVLPMAADDPDLALLVELCR